MNRDTINAKYRELGYELGWRFLACPERNLQRAEYCIITLNPGGDRIDPNHPDWSQEEGSAYVVETWKGCKAGQAPLQRQVQAIFKLLNVRSDEALTAYFVPFRSRDWDALQRKEEALRFARELWSWALQYVKARHFIAIGQKIVEEELRNLMGVQQVDEAPTGWGSSKIRKITTRDGKVLVSLPHLSRYRIFGRPGGNAEHELRKMIT